MKGYLHARLGEEDRLVLDELTRSTGRSPSEIVRRGLHLVAQEERRRRSALDLAGRSVGRFKRGPARICRPTAPISRIWRMNPAGVLLDTGPLVALLSANDANHARARRLFAECQPPFRCCEAVVAEACFLMRKADKAGPAQVAALGRRGLFTMALAAEAHWPELEALLKKYANRPISFADACLIRCAEIHGEPRIATFDRDFAVYKWARNKRFAIL